MNVRLTLPAFKTVSTIFLVFKYNRCTSTHVRNHIDTIIAVLYFTPSCLSNLLQQSDLSGALLDLCVYLIVQTSGELGGNSPIKWMVELLVPFKG